MCSLKVMRIQLWNEVGFRIVSQSRCWSIEHHLFFGKLAWLDSPGKEWTNYFSTASQPVRAVSGLSILPEAPRRAVSVLELSYSASSSPVVSLIQSPWINK